MANRVSYIILAKDAFTGVARKVVTQTKAMQRNFAKLDKKLKFTSGRFDGLASAALGFFGARAFLTEGMKFEDQIADLGSIVGATGAQLDGMADDALRLAKISKVSASEVAEGFKIIASGKSDLLDTPGALAEVTEQILLLKNASGSDMATASKLVVSSLNQFKASSKDAAKFVNIIAAGTQVGAAEMEDLAPAIVKSSVAARMAGLSFEELNASIQVLAQGGLQGDVIGTGLQTMFIKLESGKIRKFKPSIMGLAGALENLAAANLSPARAAKVFGLEALKQGAIMVENRKQIAAWTKEITGTNTAQMQAKIRLATTSAQLRGMSIMLNDKVIKAFQRFSPELKSAAQDLGAFFDTIDSDNINTFVSTLKTVGSAIRMIAKSVSLAIQGLKVMGTIMGEGLARWAVDKSFNPIQLVPSLMRAAGDDKAQGEVRKLIDMAVGTESKASMEITVKDKGGNVESVKTTAKSPTLQIGTNMVTGGAA